MRTALFTALALSTGSLASGCTMEPDADDFSALDASIDDLDDELTDDPEDPNLLYDESASISAAPDPASSLSCTQHNDCRSSCLCTAGTCSPNPGVGPQPPAGYCDEPPTRSCSSGFDCNTGCICSGGTCAPGGVGPLAPDPDCHLPPDDPYEYDDTWPNYRSYVGPQRHSFHTSTDRDWMGVYIGTPGLVRFATHSLSHGADTRIKVFAWDGVSKGPLLGTNDDIGGPWWWADSRSSRVDLQVEAGSAFLVKVINESNPSLYTTAHEWPSYTLEVSAL